MRTTPAAALAVLMSFCWTVHAGAPTVSAFLRDGDPVPGMPDFTFGAGGQAVLSDDGSVLFVAQIEGPGSTLFNNHVLVIERPDGSREVLAREADPVPGVPGFIYRGGSANTAVFNEPVISDTGGIGVVCEVLQGTTVRQMILTDTPTGPGLTPAAWGTQPVVADLGSSIDQVYQQSASIHEGGLITFMGRTFGTSEGTVQGFWFGSSLGLTTALQTDLPAPGFGPGIDVTIFDPDALASSASGDVVFPAVVEGPGLPGGFARVVYSGDPTNLGVLAQSGGTIPGTGGIFSFFYDDAFKMNDAGAICFFAQSTGNTNVIMTYGGGQGSVLAGTGGPIAALPGLTYQIDPNRLEMNAHAEIAFVSRLGGAPFATDTALFVGEPSGGIDLIVREGDMIDGYAVENIGSGYFAMNDRRDIVIQLGLSGQSAIVAFPGDGSPAQVLARQTSPLITDRGGFSLGALVPWRINFGNGSTETGRSMALDNRGRFALNVLGGTGDWIVIFDIDGPCVADFNNDNATSFPDVGLFLAAFAAGDLAADIDGDGSVSFPDVGAFLGGFAAGCP